jgi:hypothetical protein
LRFRDAPHRVRRGGEMTADHSGHVARHLRPAARTRPDVRPARDVISEVRSS